MFYIQLFNVEPDAFLPVLKSSVFVLFGIPIHYGVQHCVGLVGDSISEIAKDDPVIVGGDLDVPLIHNSVHGLGDGEIHWPFNSIFGLVWHTFSKLPPLSFTVILAGPQLLFSVWKKNVTE